MWPSRSGADSCTSARDRRPARAGPLAAAASASALSYRTMPAPLPPMFAFTSTGKRRSSRRCGRLRGVVDHAARGYGSPSSSSRSSWIAFEISSPYDARPVHDRDAEALEVPQPVQRVERRLPVPAQVRRRARAIEDERVRRLGLRRIEECAAASSLRTESPGAPARRRAAGTSRGARGRSRSVRLVQQAYHPRRDWRHEEAASGSLAKRAEGTSLAPGGRVAFALAPRL